MNFFEHQERARHKTGLLIVYFIAAVIMIIGAVYLAVAGVFVYGQERHDKLPTLWYPQLLLVVSVATLIVIAVGSLTKIAELSGGGEVVARALGGRRVLPDTRDLRERVLLNVVEEMAIASGTPVPPVFLLDAEPGINAFAAGTSPQNAVVAVTRGSIQTLRRDELQGVIAHEFSHILNGDMRLNIRLIGLLNGILLIAMIGYFLMRTTSSSSSDNKKGGNGLAVLGIGLFVIGYVGVFFGNLIKSAVSRQREFLADASAVQFTRLPDGISNALKKIGGLVAGSRLKSPRAAEASHMYFGNGMGHPILEMLATHPPLAERIKRLDPTFDGRYPQVEEVTYTPDDLINPQTLAAQRDESMLATAATIAATTINATAAAGAQSFAQQPALAVAQVGAPRSEHLDYAASMVVALPPELVDNVRNPLGAVATIYALLLADSAPAARDRQLQYLATKVDPRANEETLRLAPIAESLNPEMKLPLVSMALPALKGLSPRQLAAFRDDLTFLIQVDQQVSLFEYAVHRLIYKRLLPRLEQKPAPLVKYDRFAPLLPACTDLLSTLAYCGTRNDRQAAAAFHLGAAQLPAAAASIQLLPGEQCGWKAVDAALDLLAGAAPALKKHVLDACAACIGADETVTVEEGELLRVIADALDCPMPPLLAPRSSQAADSH